MRRVSWVIQLVVWNVGATVALLACVNGVAYLLNKIHLRPANPYAVVHETDQRESGLVPHRLRVARKEFHGTQLNIDRDGWRTGKADGLLFDDWSDANYNLFFVGGSAAFGYTVDDEQTIAAHFEGLGRQEGKSHLRVYNLGQMGYQIHDEITLLVDVLRQGYVPDVVVFYDGANEAGRGLPSRITDNVLARYVEGDYANWLVGYLRSDEPILKFENLALAKLAARVRQRLAPAGGGDRSPTI